MRVSKEDEFLYKIGREMGSASTSQWREALPKRVRRDGKLVFNGYSFGLGR